MSEEVATRWYCYITLHLDVRSSIHSMSEGVVAGWYCYVIPLCMSAQFSLLVMIDKYRSIARSRLIMLYTTHISSGNLIHTVAK